MQASKEYRERIRRPPPYQRQYPHSERWRAPAAPKECGARPANFALTPDWRCVLKDKFTTSNLDTQRWWTRYTHNDGWLDYLNDEQERYGESGNHVMTAPGLDLTALPKVGDIWPSGMIRSKDLVPIHDGNEWFIECRGLVPNGLGVWPAFWIASCESVAGDDASCLWPPELDMMEIVNNGVEDTTAMLHCGCQVLNWDTNPQGYAVYWYTENFNAEWGTWWAPYDFAEAYHSWGVKYQRPNYTIYCDREPIVEGTYDWVYDNGQVCPGAYILCNLAIGGSWAGRHGVDDSAMPQAFSVDYIGVWTRMPQSTIGHDLMPNGG